MKNKVLSFYDFFLIAGVIASNIAYSVLSGSIDAVGSIAGIAGVICVVLVAKGSIWNYAFGIINVSMYAYISYKAALYGDAGLNALYYLPMQFIGWWSWRKRGAATSQEDADRISGEGADVRVCARRLTWIQRAILAVGCAAAVFGFGLLLGYFGDPQPYKDSATTVLSIVAQALMAMAFMEQWVLWIITNILSVIMWCFYLLNSINGLRVWLSLSRK